MPFLSVSSVDDRPCEFLHTDSRVALKPSSSIPCKQNANAVIAHSARGSATALVAHKNHSGVRFQPWIIDPGLYPARDNARGSAAFCGCVEPRLRLHHPPIAPAAGSMSPLSRGTRRARAASARTVAVPVEVRSRASADRSPVGSDVVHADHRSRHGPGCARFVERTDQVATPVPVLSADCSPMRSDLRPGLLWRVDRTVP